MTQVLASRWWLAMFLLLGCQVVQAQGLPVVVNTSGNVATIAVGDPANPVADVTVTFDDAIGLSPASLGVSAQLVSLDDPALLARLPNFNLTSIDPSFPLMVTIEPPTLGGLRFNGTAKVEIHTHALAYSLGSFYRLFKAPVGGNFRDITDQVTKGSIRARGNTGGFSQFLVLADVRQTEDVIVAKLAWLRARVNALPAVEQPGFLSHLDAIEASVAAAQLDDAIVSTNAFSDRALTLAGTTLTNQWRATRDVDNQAGELAAGASTLKFSLAYLRDFGQ